MSIRELRQLINNLNLDISQAGLIAGIQSLLQSYQDTYAIPITAQLKYPSNFLSLVQELDILRIVQESLSNACKHSQASQISISVQPDVDANYLLIWVDDNGIGCDADLNSTKKNHWGIYNIKNRASRLNAELKISSAVGIGTQVRLKVPLARL
jgi:two-component system nitrate/nitrite sensor histidine kinase NarX